MNISSKHKLLHSCSISSHILVLINHFALLVSLTHYTLDLLWGRQKGLGKDQVKIKTNWYLYGFKVINFPQFLISNEQKNGKHLCYYVILCIRQYALSLQITHHRHNDDVTITKSCMSTKSKKYCLCIQPHRYYGSVVIMSTKKASPEQLYNYVLQVLSYSSTESILSAPVRQLLDSIQCL